MELLLHPPRLAIVVSHPIQHFCPLYRELARSVNLRVFFGSSSGAAEYFDPSFNRTIRWAGDLLSGFDHRFLPGAENVTPAAPIDCKELPAALTEFDPDFVQTYGFYHPISRRALLWAKRRRRITLLISDSELRTRRPLLVRARKRFSVPLLLKLVDRFLTVGDRNEDYYASYGASRSQFFRSPFPIDTGLLDAALANQAAIREETRRALGIGSDVQMALVVGKLTTRKACQHVLDALSWISRRRPDTPPIVAVFVGDGPERANLEQFAKEHCPGAARFPGFINVDELPRYYVSSDLLVHPSSEDPHPLATAEAAFAGLPMIVSDRVGSVGPTDDVRPGINALEYRFGDIEALAAGMIRLASDGALRRAFAYQSRQIGLNRTLEHSAAGYLRALGPR
jgi:glycosyltransferase involved in cell wall biosynthesis